MYLSLIHISPRIYNAADTAYRWLKVFAIRILLSFGSIILKVFGWKIIKFMVKIRRNLEDKEKRERDTTIQKDGGDVIQFV